MTGMNPQQHANRAEELAAEAAQMYTDLRRDIEAGDPVDDTIWRFLDTTVQIGQLHAALALRTLPTGPSFVPTYEDLDLTGATPGSVYGDDEPARDRK